MSWHTALKLRNKIMVSFCCTCVNTMRNQITVRLIRHLIKTFNLEKPYLNLVVQSDNQTMLTNRYANIILKGVCSTRKKMPPLYIRGTAKHWHSYLLVQGYCVTNLLGRKQLAHTFHNLGQLINSGNISVLRYLLAYLSSTSPKSVILYYLQL